jgi:hypothetical protein
MTPFFEEFEQQLRSAAKRQTAGQALRRWAKQRRIGLVAVLAVGVASPALARVTGVWDPGLESQPPAQTETVSSSEASSTCSRAPSSARPPDDAQLDPRLLEQLAVLRRPQRPVDVLPDASRLRVTGQSLLADSVRYLGSVDGRRYFAAAVISDQRGACSSAATAAQTQLCLLHDNGSAACGIRPREFRAHGMTSSSGAHRHSVVAGLVPDAVKAVTVRYGTSKRSFPVRNNFYGYRIAVAADRTPDAVTWTLRSGQRRQIR